MSRWMYPTGELWYAGDVADIAALIEQDDWPHGSEGPTNYSVFTWEGETTVTIDGSLRDRGYRSDFNDVRVWFKRLIATPQITKGYIEVQTSKMFCCGFYYANDEYQEVIAPVDAFIDIKDYDE